LPPKCDTTNGYSIYLGFSFLSFDWDTGNTHVVAAEVVDRGLGEHGVVLQLGLAKRRAVTSDQDL
jgi:hypothetical protein